MQRRCCVFLLCLLGLCNVNSASAQTDTLSIPIISTLRGSTGNVIPIILNNKTPVRAVQMVIAYDRNIVTVDNVRAEARIQALSTFSFNIRPGVGTAIDTVRIVAIDTGSPIDSIPNGSGAIASFIFRTGTSPATVPLSFVIQGEDETALFGSNNMAKPLGVINGLVANGPPVVSSVTENTGGNAKTVGDTIRITVTGTPSVDAGNGLRSITGSFDIGIITARVAMTETPIGSGTYVGAYVVKNRDVAKNAQIIGRLSDIGGREATLGSSTRVNIDAAPPVFVDGPTVSAVFDSAALVTWTTDEPTFGTMQYGIGNFDLSSGLSTTQTTHTVRLLNLLPKTTYQLRVFAVDEASNQALSDTVKFTTLPTPDTRAPIFNRLPLAVGRSDSTLTLQWTASEPARAVITLTDGAINRTDSTTTFSVDGQYIARKLIPNTRYTGTISLTDAAGNGPNTDAFDNNPAAISGTTLPAPDTTPPRLLTQPVVRGITDIAARILYTTDEPAIGVIQFGLTPALGAQVVDSTITTAQNIPLTNLPPNTRIFFRASAIDGSNNQTAFTAVDSFTTTATPDITPPNITEGPTSSNVTSTTALIQWKTDELATSRVRFKKSTDPDTAFVTVVETSRKLNHQVTLPGAITSLAVNTEYVYQVSSTDASGNTSPERSGRFRTKQVVDTAPPKFLAKPVVTFIDTGSVVVQWQTDKTSDSRGSIDTTKTLNVTTAVDPTLTTGHRLTFTNLIPNTRYFFVVTSVDPTGNSASSVVDSVRTRAKPDTIPPQIASLTTVRTDTASALISWRTSKLANSRIVFGTAPSTLDRLFVEGTPAIDRQVTLTGLSPGTTYYYRVQSTDQNANTSAFQPLPPNPPRQFTTAAVRDTIPPILTNVRTENLTATSARIVWESDEASNTVVRFGTFPTLLLSTQEDGTLSRSHVSDLTNLTPNQTYHFEVTSTDAALNTGTFPGPSSPRLSFTTVPALSDSLAPLITRGPGIAYNSDTQAIIEWDTDELSNSLVYFQRADALSQPFELVARQDLTFNHAVTVSGLVPGVQYVFVVSSSDAARNEVRFPPAEIIPVVTKFGVRYRVTAALQGVGSFGRFTTNQGPDAQAPVVLFGPTILDRTSSSITIQWVTDELATSVVDFGVGTLNQRRENGDLVTTHTVTLNNLTSGAIYTYAVSSSDPTGNGPTQSTTAIATTPVTPDVAPPVITQSPTVASNSFIDNTNGARAIIKWKTDEPSNSVVNFGTTTSLGTVVTDPTPTKDHSVTITRLTPATVYQVRVSSTDQSNNGPTQSSLISFTAASTPDVTPPAITNVSTTLTTGTQLTVTWSTDELASSFLRAVKAGTTDTLSVESANFVNQHSLTIADSVFVRPSTSYTVLIGAIDASVNKNESTSSINVTTPAAPDTIPPAGPASLSVVPGNTTVTLRWQANTEEDLAGYHVFQRLGSQPTGNNTQIASLVTEPNFDVSNLVNDLPYTFTVQAVDRRGNLSTQSTVVAQPSPTSAPGKPFAASPSNNQVVSRKPILVSTNATKPTTDPNAVLTYAFAVFSDSALTNPVASVTGIAEGSTFNPTHWQVENATFSDGVAFVDQTKYWWQVRANDGANNGPWSSPVTFIADFNRPVGVALTTLSASSERGVVTIVWQVGNAPDIAGFHISRGLSAQGPFERLTTRPVTGKDNGYTFTDTGVRVNATYYYILEPVGSGGVTEQFGPIAVRVTPPLTYALDQNYPNPFNPTTTIRYQLPAPGRVSLIIYNLLGQEVITLVDEPQPAGFHTTLWNGRNRNGLQIASGVYFYRIVVRDDHSNTPFTSGRKMLLLK